MGRDNNKGFYQGGSAKFYGDESGGATRTSKWVTQDQVSYAFTSAGNPIVNGKARCPLHGDNTPSMSVDVKEGRLLVYCHVCGGSRQKELIEAVRREVSLDARGGDGRGENGRGGNGRGGMAEGEFGRVSGVLPRIESNAECSPQIQQVWDTALEIEPGQVTAYCADKNVNAYGLKRLRNGTTLVPMYAAGGLGPLVGIQKILVASDPISKKSKLNVPGSVKDGSALIVGWGGKDLSQLRNAALIVCEGYSTAATVYEVVQGEYPILPDGAKVYAVCAFGVGNVLPVAKALKQALSPLSARILVGVDADSAGMRVAEDAAALGFGLCIPDFGDLTGQSNAAGEGTRAHEALNDWNDACAALGAETVAVQLRENLARTVETAPKPDKAGDSKRGEGEERGRGRRKKRELASYRDYLDLLRASYPEKEPRLDLVSGEIKVFERGQWQKPDLLILRSTARESDGFYDHTAILDHLSKCAREMTPELLLDVAPVWDGIDRIAVFSDALSTRTFDKKSLRELLEHWLVGVIRKAFDPQEMNHVLVLQGVSGCGKDIWVRRLLRAFTAPWDPTRTVVDGYVTNMNVSGQMDEEDWARFLYKYLVVNISEFDKIKGDARGAAVFKSVTTAEVVAWRPKYEEDVKARPVRASIIASLNPKDINEDSAGARRYIPIELSGHPYSKGAEGAAIDWSYGDTIEKGGEDFYLQLRAQIMLGAQGKRKPLDWATQDSLTEVQEDLTPDDSVNVTIAAILEDARERLRVGALLEHEEGGREQMEWEGATWEVRRVGNGAFQPIVREHCGLTGESQKKVLNRMGQCRLSWRSKTTRGWKVPFSKV